MLHTGSNTLAITVSNIPQSGDAVNNPAGLLYALTVNDTECSTGGGGGDAKQSFRTTNCFPFH